MKSYYLVSKDREPVDLDGRSSTSYCARIKLSSQCQPVCITPHTHTPAGLHTDFQRPEHYRQLFQELSTQMNLQDDSSDSQAHALCFTFISKSSAVIADGQTQAGQDKCTFGGGSIFCVTSFYTHFQYSFHCHILGL